MTPYKHQSWPAWFYGPNGEAEIFNEPQDVPKGWHDDPKKFEDEDATTEVPGLDEALAAAETPEPEGPEAYNDITVASLKAHLDGAGVEYDSDDNKSALYELYEQTF